MNGGTTGQGKWLGQLIFGAIMMVASLVVLVMNLKWITTVFAGPVEIKLADLRAVDNPRDLPNQWVSFTFEQGLDTGVQLVSNRSNTPKARYLLVQVQDRWLIAEVPPDHAGTHIIGYVEAWSAPLNRKVITDIQGKFPGYTLLPVQVDAVYNQRSQCYAMLGVTGFFVIGGLALVVLGLVTRRRLLREVS
jgi:hypothetical protein